jgi:glycosyltransferase involved in cell wall biosynthesis
MERNRGAQLMVQAFHHVWQEIPQARLLHIGPFTPPELEAEVRVAVAQRGLENAATFTGRVPFEQIGGYLQRVAVGWVTWQPVPKNEKNIPTKLFEYMAYGLPVVCSDLLSTRPFISDGENGYLVAADDSAAHAAAILGLLRRPETAVVMGQRGQRLVQAKYNWSTMEARLLALYQEVLS